MKGAVGASKGKRMNPSMKSDRELQEEVESRGSNLQRAF